MGIILILRVPKIRAYNVKIVVGLPQFVYHFAKPNNTILNILYMIQRSISPITKGL